MKEEQFHLRVDATDKALVRCAAKEAGVSASRFILDVAVQAAEEAVARQNRFVVPAARWVEFVEALDGTGDHRDRSPGIKAEDWLRDRGAL